MTFLIDAQLPRRLARRLAASGHDALHTLDLPAGNRTPDSQVIEVADRNGRIVVTKDDDFVNTSNDALERQPRDIKASSFRAIIHRSGIMTALRQLRLVALLEGTSFRRPARYLSGMAMKSRTRTAMNIKKSTPCTLPTIRTATGSDVEIANLKT